MFVCLLQHAAVVAIRPYVADEREKKSIWQEDFHSYDDDDEEDFQKSTLLEKGNRLSELRKGHTRLACATGGLLLKPGVREGLMVRAWPSGIQPGASSPHESYRRHPAFSMKDWPCSSLFHEYERLTVSRSHCYIMLWVQHNVVLDC